MNHDTLSSIESVIGSLHDDVLVGDGGANMLEGGEGNDSLTGGEGADILYGGAGNDTFLVASNNDLASGETIDGGTGTDILKVGSAAVTLVDLTAVTMSGVETIDMSSGDSASTLMVGNDDLAGVSQIIGNDSTIGLADGGVILDLTGKTLSGITGIEGGTGADIITTYGSGDRTITGGSGVDTLTLNGTGVETVFYFSTASLGDVIHGFDSGTDTLSFSQMFQGGDVNGVALFSSDDPLSGSSGRGATDLWLLDTDDHILYYDADGSAATIDAKVVATLDTNILATDISIVGPL